MLFLAFKWEQFQETGFLSAENWDLDKLSAKDPLFEKYPALSIEKTTSKSCGFPEGVTQNKNVLHQILSKALPDNLITIESSRTLSVKQKKRGDNVDIQAFFTGPEDDTSDWEQSIVEGINQARDRVLIDQMYFHPSKKIMNAIIAAANRDVKITIVTAIGGRHPSRSEKFFGHRNLCNIYFLAKLKNKKINLFGYSQGKNGLHKKVIVADDYVFAGSSNMGTKSLELMGDHEMNFKARSKRFSDQVAKIIGLDIRKSKKIKNLKLSFKNRVFSFIHSAGSNLWG